MTKRELIQLFQQFSQQNIELMVRKNADYAHDDEDSTANFKRHAEELGVTPYFIWRVYAGKHFDAITKFCRDGHVESEEIYGRIQDMAVYLVLLLALIRDCDAGCGVNDTVAHGPFGFISDPGKMHKEPPAKLL